jgi:hypothetical protein
MQLFFGYGTYSANYWFIGMEHGGGNTLEEIQKRLLFWQYRGRNELEDMGTYHEQLGYPQYFTDPVKLQRTLAQLCRMVLSSKNESTDITNIKNYQKEELGRISGSTCLLELLPLPSPSINHWLYSEWSSLDFLKSREAYKNNIIHSRIQAIKNRIKINNPRSIIFYGKGYIDNWEEITGVPFDKNSVSEFQMVKRDSTLFLSVHHPSARGITNDYFENAGKVLRDCM